MLMGKHYGYNTFFTIITIQCAKLFAIGIPSVSSYFTVHIASASDMLLDTASDMLLECKLGKHFHFFFLQKILIR